MTAQKLTSEQLKMLRFVKAIFHKAVEDSHLVVVMSCQDLDFRNEIITKEINRDTDMINFVHKVVDVFERQFKSDVDKPIFTEGECQVAREAFDLYRTNLSTNANRLFRLYGRDNEMGMKVEKELKDYSELEVAIFEAIA